MVNYEEKLKSLGAKIRHYKTNTKVIFGKHESTYNNESFEKKGGLAFKNKSFKIEYEYCKALILEEKKAKEARKKKRMKKNKI